MKRLVGPISRRSGRRGRTAVVGILQLVAFISPLSGWCLSAFALDDAGRAGALTPTVRTSAGDVQGVVVGDVREYLGIPYAAPPQGDLRWRPPQEVQPWKSSRRAMQFGNTCAQQQRGVFAAPSTSEDCLFLNVFSSNKGATAGRPVMVWFHGGGLFSGESNDYDGSKLVQRGDVIVVTFNYRVGVFGFLSHPSLNAEGHAHANYGIMDQQFALKWVQRNIAAFGGDPYNVTIFGQSGGGTSVMANLESPLSRGLFQKAINMSGTRIARVTPQTTIDDGVAFATSAGCLGPEAASCLRKLSVDQVLSHSAVVVRHVTDFPAVDGTVVTRTAFDAFSHGDFNRVPILTGLVADEQGFFLPEARTHKPLTTQDVELYIDSFGKRWESDITSAYRPRTFDNPTLAEVAIAQGSKACTARMLTREWAKYVPVYTYEFRDRTAPSYFPALSYPMRAYHTAELQYLFPMFHGGQGTPHPLDGPQEKLSDEMVDFWTSFATHGTPGKDEHAWPRYTAAADNVEVLDLSSVRSENDYGQNNKCGLWEKILSY